MGGVTSPDHQDETAQAQQNIVKFTRYKTCKLKYYKRKMESVSNMIRVSLPNYFSNLPVPSSIGGWFSLSVGDWMRLIPFGAAVGGLSYLSLKGLASTPVVGPYIQNTMSKVPGFQPGRINNSIKLDSPKVVDTVEIEDIGD